MAGKTIFEKVWAEHVVTETDDGNCLLAIDRHLLHEGSRHAFDVLRTTGRAVRRPAQTFAFADHYVPTEPTARRRGKTGIDNPQIRSMLDQIESNCVAANVRLYGLDDPQQGIVHVVGPEQGLILPGLSIVCGDSHTSTHGAFGAIAFGIGATEVAHILATQTLWQRPPRQLRVVIEGELALGVTPKDMALALIASIGASGGTGFAVEYAGAGVSALSMEGRMTLCNLTIEAGARFGIIAPDETTFAWLHSRRYAPRGATWDDALGYWRTLRSDDDARVEREVTLEVGSLVPLVTWGTSPQDAIAVTGLIPRADDAPDEASRARVARALEYMGLEGGAPIQGVPVDRVFIGSCTNGRIEDLRAAATVLRRKRIVAQTLVVPASRAVKAQAEAEGLAEVFVRAGCDWREPGCSMCLGTNGDTLAPGERCASTSNRNFEGRQGRLGRTHLVSPLMAAAAALTGKIVDVRTMLERA